jgi:hypothetical protein
VPAPADADDVELGAVGPDLRLWRAREAVRQGELALHHQSLARDNIGARALALLGWAVTISIASIGAATLGNGHPGIKVAAGLVLLGLSATAVACVVAIYPRRWARPGYDPTQLLRSQLPSELETLENLALGLGEDVTQNRATLIVGGIFLRVAWIVFASTPLPALAALAQLGVR